MGDFFFNFSKKVFLQGKKRKGEHEKLSVKAVTYYDKSKLHQCHRKIVESNIREVSIYVSINNLR